jgi:predicted Zn finger-like uncharacterized protein
MYVACPSCHSLYTISAGQLAAAGGEVRCSQCQALFNASQAVFDDPRQALAYKHRLQQDLVQEIDELVGRALDQVPGASRALSAGDVTGSSEAVDPSRGTSAGADEASGHSLTQDRDEGEEADTIIQAPPPLPLRADADHYAQPVTAEFLPPAEEVSDPFALPHDLLLRDASSSSARTSWGAIAAGLLLTVTLLAQYTWWDRNRLAQISVLRPALDWLCQPFDCHLPLRHDLARVEMIEREVRDHPNVKDALLVSAAFVNRAGYRQAYPVLQIAFSDISGTPVAVRRFMPEEYLHGKKPEDGMAPGEQTLVMLEVVDPGNRAVSFQFDFM